MKKTEGNECIHAEWIGYMKAYRLYDPKRPQWTVMYEEALDAAKQRALEEGYSKVVLCDADTI